VLVGNRLIKGARYHGLSTPGGGLTVSTGSWTPVVGSIDTELNEEGIVCWSLVTGQATGALLDLKISIDGESIHIGDVFRISCDIARPDMVQPAGGNFPSIWLPPSSSMTFELQAYNATVQAHLNAVVAKWYGKEWEESIPMAVCFPTQTAPPGCAE
jgi:hypothetical protein